MSSPWAACRNARLLSRLPLQRLHIGRRKDERLRRGEEEGRAQAGVLADLAGELINGRGLGIVLRKHDAEEEQRALIDAR